MRTIARGLCALWLASSALAASAGVPAKDPANVLVITLDTTRADRMGFLGSKRGLTPNLDALAQNSAVFTHAYAQAPLTPVSHATIFTGTYPQFHQVLDFPMPLARDLPFAPAILHDHGYQTAAFVGSLALDPAGGAPGFDRGFDVYDANFTPGDLNQRDRYKMVERRGGEVVARALKWLNERHKGPFFLWVHLYDPHDPYDPPEPYKTRYAAEPYDGEIAYMDSAVGNLLQDLKVRGLYDGTLIAVMADHGESLGQHGEDTHGVFLYDETIHVPLMIKFPSAGPEERIENRVELVDVLPTLLEVLGFEVPASVQGESLLGLMKAGETPNDQLTEKWRDRAAFAESDYPFLAYGWGALESWRTGRYLYVEAPRRELYDQTADPKNEHNLAAESKAVADTLAARVEAFREKTSNKREAPRITVDPATRDKLAALGYVASTSTPGNGVAAKGPDPKDKIVTANSIRQVNSLFEYGRFEEAIPILEKLVAQEPAMAILYAKLGGSYMKLHKYDEAVPVLRKAVALDPGLSMAQMDLGRSLLRVRDFNGAASMFEGIVAKAPHMLDAHFFLEIAYARADRIPETIKECNAVLEMLPEHYESYLLLGRSLAKSGDLEAAVPKLEKAANLRPSVAEPHVALAQIYEQLGRTADAARERAQAAQLGQNVVEE